MLASFLLSVACHSPSTGMPALAEAPPGEPAALEAWLAASESRFEDLVPGTEKQVVWADPASPARTPLSVVYLHGYSATRQEVRPLAERVGEELGANVFLTRLTGHGRSGEAMLDASVELWKQDALEAWAVGRTLGERVVLIGTSTGATLGAWLATTLPQDELAAFAMLSPNFGPKKAGSSMLLWPGRSLLTRLVVGETYSWEPRNEAQARYWTHSYPSAGLFPMMELVRLTELTELSSITAPAMMIYCAEDQVIDPELAQARFEEFGGTKRTREVAPEAEGSNHVVAGDILAPHNTEPLVADIVEFVREVGD